MYLAARVFTWLVAWTARDVPTAAGGTLGGGVRESVLAFASNWDGSWYQRIADVGYQQAHPGGDAFAFFPLYPFSGVALSRLQPRAGEHSRRAAGGQPGRGPCRCPLPALVAARGNWRRPAGRSGCVLPGDLSRRVCARHDLQRGNVPLSLDRHHVGGAEGRVRLAGCSPRWRVLCRLQGVLLGAPVLEVFWRCRSDGRWLSGERLAALAMPCVTLGGWLLYVGPRPAISSGPSPCRPAQAGRAPFFPSGALSVATF